MSGRKWRWLLTAVIVVLVAAVGASVWRDSASYKQRGDWAFYAPGDKSKTVRWLLSAPVRMRPQKASSLTLAPKSDVKGKTPKALCRVETHDFAVTDLGSCSYIIIAEHTGTRVITFDVDVDGAKSTVYRSLLIDVSDPFFSWTNIQGLATLFAVLVGSIIAILSFLREGNSKGSARNSAATSPVGRDGSHGPD